MKNEPPLSRFQANQRINVLSGNLSTGLNTKKSLDECLSIKLLKSYKIPGIVKAFNDVIFPGIYELKNQDSTARRSKDRRLIHSWLLWTLASKRRDGQETANQWAPEELKNPSFPRA